MNAVKYFISAGFSSKVSHINGVNILSSFRNPLRWTNYFLLCFPVQIIKSNNENTYLEVWFSSKNFFLSSGSSYSSTSLFSKTPENGIIIAPGSFLSTHSLIFINLLTKGRGNNEIRVQRRQKGEHVTSGVKHERVPDFLESPNKKNRGTSDP